MSRSDSSSQRPTAVIQLRPIATPLALGFLALAAISFVVAGDELSWIGTADSHAVALAVLVFVVPLQAVSAVLGFLSRDPAAGTGMGILCGTWAAYGASRLTSPPGSTSGALGLLLCAAAVALLVPTIASLTGKVAAGAVLLLAAARFAVTGAYELTGSPAVREASGALGLVLCGIAVYAALAFELEGVSGRTILPVGRHAHGQVDWDRDAVDEQMRHLQNEPGVRRPL